MCHKYAKIGNSILEIVEIGLIVERFESTKIPKFCVGVNSFEIKNHDGSDPHCVRRLGNP